MKTSYKSFFTFSSVVLFVLMSTFSSFAQISNDPNDNKDANACFEGGTLGGICDVTDADRDGDLDQQDKDWLWTCGWYLIRVEYGFFDNNLLDNICHDVVDVIVVEDEEPVKKKKSKEEKICYEIDTDTYKDGDGNKFTDPECTIPQI